MKNSLIKQALFGCGTRDTVASTGLLVLRMGFGLMLLLGHGMDKIRRFEELKASFFVPGFFPFNLMSPQVSLMATIAAEAGASALIVLGLMTRPAAFVVAFTMIVAGFEVLAGAPIVSMSGPSKEMALLYLIPMLVLIVTGAGSWSLDSRLCRPARRRNW